MIAEAKLFCRRKFFSLVLVILIVSVLGVIIMYSKQLASNGENSEWSFRYTNFEELETYDKNLDNEYKNLLETPNISYSVLDKYSNDLLIFKYLLKYRIEYGEFIVEEDLYCIENNWFSYIYQMNEYVAYIQLVLFVFCSLIVFTSDFHIGTYRFVYQKKQRKTILLEKSIFYYCFCIIVFVISYLILFLYGIIINYDNQIKLFIYVYNEKAVAVSVVEFIVVHLFSNFLWIMEYALIFLTIALLFRNMLAVIISDISYFFFTVIVNTKIPLFSAYYSVQYLSYQWSFFKIVLIFTIKYIIFVLLWVLTCKRTQKIDLM